MCLPPVVYKKGRPLSVCLSLNMVKSSSSCSSLKKSELFAILADRTSTSKERNRAVKLLKKFEPNPQKSLDHHFHYKTVRVNRYNQLQAFVCFRCDKVKQTNIKVQWESPLGTKIICNTCYSNLCTKEELDRIRKENATIAKTR